MSVISDDTHSHSVEESVTSDDTYLHSDEGLFILSLANLATDGFISPHLRHYPTAPMQAIEVAEACRIKLLSALAYLCSSGKISISSLQWAIQTNWQRSAQWYQSKVEPVNRRLNQLRMNPSNSGGSHGDSAYSHWIQMWPHLFAQRQAFISDLSSAFPYVHSLLARGTLGQLQSEVNELLRDYLKPLVLFKGSQQNLKWNSRTCNDRQTPSPLIGICPGTDDSLGSQSYYCLLECQPFGWFKVAHPSGGSPKMAQGSVSDLVDLTASSSKSLSRFDKPLNKLLASIQEPPQKLCEASLEADLKKIRAWSTFLSSPGSTPILSQDHERQLSALSKQLVELNKALVDDSQFCPSSDYPDTIPFDLLSPTNSPDHLFQSGTDSLRVADIRMETSTSAKTMHQETEYFLLSNQSSPGTQSHPSSVDPTLSFPLLDPPEEHNGTIAKSLVIGSTTGIALSKQSCPIIIAGTAPSDISGVQNRDSLGTTNAMHLSDDSNQAEAAHNSTDSGAIHAAEEAICIGIEQRLVEPQGVEVVQSTKDLI